MKAKKNIPKFDTEEAERSFWETHDTTEYFDTQKRVNLQFPHLRPSTKTITIRLPESLLYRLKRAANKRDVPYQSLVKMFLANQLKDE